MGVSGSGKTTIARELAARLGRPFADADDFHPETNVAKMARGEPLTDADREPWLRTLAQWIAEHHGTGRSTVLACSALKRRYRDVLRGGAPRHVAFLHLDAPRAVLLERMQHREGHYMPLELLDSQLATLERLELDEPGTTIDGAQPPATVVAKALQVLSI
jgi:gluconokinase